MWYVKNEGVAFNRQVIRDLEFVVPIIPQAPVGNSLMYDSDCSIKLRQMANRLGRFEDCPGESHIKPPLAEFLRELNAGNFKMTTETEPKPRVVRYSEAACTSMRIRSRLAGEANEDVAEIKSP